VQFVLGIAVHAHARVRTHTHTHTHTHIQHVHIPPFTHMYISNKIKENEVIKLSMGEQEESLRGANGEC